MELPIWEWVLKTLVRVIASACVVAEAIYKRQLMHGKVEFTQVPREGVVVTYSDGTPVDREGWLYMPWMARYSKRFQPNRKNGGYLYVKPLQELKGRVLEVRKNGEVLKRLHVERPLKIEWESLSSLLKGNS